MNANHREDRLWLWMFLGAMALLGATRWHFSHQSGGFTPVASRKAAPDVVLPQLGGGQWRLADHRGQVVLVNYWATWCGPCQEELPGLMRVAREAGPKGLAVVGVSLDSGPDTRSTVQQFVAANRVPYPVAFPDATWTGHAGVTIPTTVLLDRRGRIVKTYVGAVDHDDFARDVAALLAES
jgi:cytochrome c biogenesis protein CcmG/thiol:disulfide interchange protein DsbE